MRLTVDLGNTRVSIARVVHGRVAEFRAFERRDRAGLARALGGWARRHRGAFGAAAIASVVPRDSAAIAALVRATLGVRLRRFPRDFPGAIAVRPKPASRVGADRLANALGALALAHPHASGDAIVVDVGTAATVDLVSARGVFEGGMIAPGPRLGARALAAFTAQLPEVRFARAASPVGRSTRAAIGAGLWFGFRGLTAALVREAQRARPRARVIAAGGDGARCLRGTGIRFTDAPGLTHLGLDRALELSGAPS